MTWPNYRTQVIVVAAGQSSDRFVAGRFLRALTSTGTLDVLPVGGSSNQAQPLATRTSIGGSLEANGRPSEIGPVTFRNNTGVSITATIATSDGPIGDDRGDSDAGTIAGVNLTGSAITLPVSRTIGAGELVQGQDLMFVTITVPTSAGNASTLAALIAAGVDHSTGVAPTGARIARIIGTRLIGPTAALNYGGSATVVPVTLGAGIDLEFSATDAESFLFLRNAVAGTLTAYVACTLSA